MKSAQVLLRVQRAAAVTRRWSAVIRVGLAVILLAGLATGCGGPTAHEVVPVSGTVTLDEQPTQGIHVTFTPLAEGQIEAGPGSAALTDEQGRFTLQTAEASRRSGAVPGKHSVIFSFVTEQAPDDDSIQTQPQVTLPERYGDGSETFEVPAAGTDQANFDLKTQ